MQREKQNIADQEKCCLLHSLNTWPCRMVVKINHASLPSPTNRSFSVCIKFSFSSESYVNSSCFSLSIPSNILILFDFYMTDFCTYYNLYCHQRRQRLKVRTVLMRVCVRWRRLNNILRLLQQGSHLYSYPNKLGKTSNLLYSVIGLILPFIFFSDLKSIPKENNSLNLVMNNNFVSCTFTAHHVNLLCYSQSYDSCLTVPCT